jgi:hypothetical protein
LVKVGPSHTTTPTTTHERGRPAGPARDPEKPEQPGTNRAGPIPQDPTARLDDPHPHIHGPHPPPRKGAIGSTGFHAAAARLMVNVPQSEAPPPQDRRLRNDE